MQESGLTSAMLEVVSGDDTHTHISILLKSHLNTFQAKLKKLLYIFAIHNSCTLLPLWNLDIRAILHSM